MSSTDFYTLCSLKSGENQAIISSAEKEESGIQKLTTKDIPDHQSQQTLVTKRMAGSGRTAVGQDLQSPK